MNIFLLDNGTKYLDNLRKLLEKYGKVFISKEVDYDLLKNCSVIVLSGGHKYFINEHPEFYKKEIELIRIINKPILGVCLGSEIIAYTFRAKLEFLKNKQKGLKKIKIIRNGHIFNNIPNFKVYENHQLTIMSLSSELDGLARSESGYEIIKHKTKEIYGFQFHPEMFEEKTGGDEIFNNLLGSWCK